MDMDRSVVPQPRVPWLSIGYPAAGSSAASSAGSAASSSASSSASSPDEPRAGAMLYDQLDIDDERGDEDVDNMLMQNIALQ